MAVWPRTGCAEVRRGSILSLMVRPAAKWLHLFLMLSVLWMTAGKAYAGIIQSGLGHAADSGAHAARANTLQDSLDPPDVAPGAGVGLQQFTGHGQSETCNGSCPGACAVCAHCTALSTTLSAFHLASDGSLLTLASEFPADVVQDTEWRPPRLFS